MNDAGKCIAATVRTRSSRLNPNGEDGGSLAAGIAKGGGHCLEQLVDWSRLIIIHRYWRVNVDFTPHSPRYKCPRLPFRLAKYHGTSGTGPSG